MNFWGLWLIGIVITIITAIVIRTVENPYQKWIYMLVTFCIVTVGGIADGKFFGMIWSVSTTKDRIVTIILTIIIMAATYIVGYAIVGLYYFKKTPLKVYFVAVFIISVIGWTATSYNYNKNYEKNVETITETIEQKEERQLIYFYNVPVQEISGSVEGSSVLGSGRVEGTTATTHEVSYMYETENNGGDWGFAPVESSEMVFHKDDTTPYVEIISYRTQTTIINHNNGTEDTRTDKEWTEYKFHLPEAFKQYKLE